jgi:hypothetical protein
VPFTSGSLLVFMEGVLGPLTAQLGLDTSDQLTIEVQEIERLLGHTIAEEDDDTKLTILARWRAWLAAVTALAGSSDLKAGSVDLKLSQQFKQASMMLAYAETAASAYSEAASVIGGGNIATVTSLSPAWSPYS